MHAITVASVSSLTVFLWAANAYAQQGGSAEDTAAVLSARSSARSAQASSGAPQIEEVVVSAQRREENLQSTPVAVTAITAEQLQNRGVQNIYDLQNVTPSLSVGTQTAGPGASAATFFIRGLGQQRSGNGSEPAVALYIDDFYYPALAGNILKALDVKQVEVLRGPQGTLFGRNTIGGAIRYQTNKPSNEFGGYVEASAGSYSRTNISGAVNVPLGDLFAMRLTAATLEQDGFQDRRVDSGRNGATEDDLGRVQLRFTPNADLTVDVSYEAYESKLTAYPVYVPRIQVQPGTVGLFHNLRRNPDYTQDYASPAFDTAYGGLPRDSFDVARVHNLHGVIDYRVNDGLQLKLLSGQSVVKDEFFNDVDASPLPVADQFQRSRTEGLSQELQALGDIGARVHYVVGLFYYDEHVEAVSGQTLTPPAGPLSVTTQVAAERQRYAFSGYTNVTFDVTNKLSLTGGYRSGDERTEADVLNLNTGVTGEADEKVDLSLPMARIQYQWSLDVMTYLSASRGFRAGGFNTALNPQLSNNGIIPFDPETVWSYEIGTRAEVLDGRLRINPTVFYTSYDDIQVQRVPPGSTTPILENAGKAHIYGLELESLARLAPGLSVTAALSYLHAKYDEILPGITSITLSTPFPRTPDWSFSIGAQYRFVMESGSNLDFNVGYSYRTKQWSTSNNDALPIDAYGLLNARAAYRTPSGAWSFAVYGNNLADEEYVAGGVDLRPVVGLVRYDVGRPREIGLDARFNF
jgi:iron complex outermembrane receptor protein